MPPRNGAEFSPELKRLFIIAKSLKITSEHRRCAMSVVHGRCKTSIPSLSTPDVLESESYIEGYGQSYDAAPTVLLLFSGNFHPPESLRDPEGLRTGWHDSRERRRCGISTCPCITSMPSLSTPDVLESESFIEGYGQSIDAAPTVLLLFSGNFHPPESLRDPEGLRTCRP